jgi:peptidyl-dipeptidase A
MVRFIGFSLVLTAAFVFSGCTRPITEEGFEKFLDKHVARIDPLYKEEGLTSWDAEVTGKAEYFEKLKKLRLEATRIYSDREDFEFLKALRESGVVKDHRLSRQLDKLYWGYLTNQGDQELKKDMVELSTSITERYNKFRGTIDGREVTMSDIYLIMTTESDVVMRKKAWLASKQVGPVIVEDFLRLVKMRNKAARELGFENYHHMSLVTNEQSVDKVDAIFAELERLTREPFAKLKVEVDEILAKEYGIRVEDLRPWHYHDPFFQRTPLVYELNLDDYYAKHDVKELSEKYYASVGLPVDDILARSDLYDKEGKNPHAFGQDVDRHGDVRILCNLNNDERWMETILHELGHAIYAKYHDSSEPYLLREPAHAFTTEAMAMFFGRLSRNAAWMQQMLGLSDEEREEVAEVAEKYLAFGQVLFARWAMVMYNFEKEVYAHPDRDLNNLWWDMVQEYQLVNRPDEKADAGWVSKLHFTVAPCYYHNYMLGELFASQLHHYIVGNILKADSDEQISYVDEPEVGEYLREKVLGPGAVYQWNEMIERATGEELTPKYFVEQFVK